MESGWLSGCQSTLPYRFISRSRIHSMLVLFIWDIIHGDAPKLHSVTLMISSTENDKIRVSVDLVSSLLECKQQKIVARWVDRVRLPERC